MRQADPVVASMIGALMVIGVAACDQVASTQPETPESPADYGPQYSATPAGDQERRELDPNDPNEIELPASVVVRLKAFWPEGFERPAHFERPEIANVRHGKAAIPVHHPDVVSHARNSLYQRSWQGVVRDGRAQRRRSAGTDVEPFKICAPDDPDPIACDPAPPPPDDGDSSEPPSWSYTGNSFAIISDFGSSYVVDFGSFSKATKPVTRITVTGYSFIDGSLAVSLHDEANGATEAAVSWFFDGFAYPYAQWFQQQGEHSIFDDDPAYDYPDPCSCFSDQGTSVQNAYR